jgi:nucleotide-binding universal stress UspA family protein
VAATIVEEARQGYDLIVLATSTARASMGGVVEAVVEGAPCHVAIIKGGPEGAEYRRVIVPIDGSTVARVAAEFAVRYAEVAGAELTLALATELRPQVAEYVSEESGVAALALGPGEAELERISRVFRASQIKPNVLRFAYDPSHSALGDEVASGKYDLVVLGAENRAIQHRLFFGYENERLLATPNVGVAIVVPNIAQLR